MIIKQVTVIVENKEGKLKEVMDILAARNINVEALGMSDTVTRLIVADPVETKHLLEEYGYEVELTDVISVKIPEDKPGALAGMLVRIAEEHINLEYMYSYASGSGLIMYPSDVEKTNELLVEWDA